VRIFKEAGMDFTPLFVDVNLPLYVSTISNWLKGRNDLVNSTFSGLSAEVASYFVTPLIHRLGWFRRVVRCLGVELKTIIHLPGLPGALMHELKIRLCLVATGVYINNCTEASTLRLFIEVGTHETPG
jgi:hypothetical protein